MMTEKKITRIKVFAEQHKEETLELLKELASIPAPSHHEEKKAAFCKAWLEKQGAKGVYIDEALNVVFPYCCEDADEVVVFMAHTDVVFPDTDPFYVKEEGEKLLAPGIGDDNANLANLMMCVKCVIENRMIPNLGVVFVANSCEEGLGNLKGSRQIYEAFGGRIREFISFDGYYHSIVDKAVGSHRYKVTVKTEGGHSYDAFGNDNAIQKLAAVIGTLYQMKVPEKAKTTYNVGMIEGGTSVNTIAEEASMLYEFRSECHECLNIMEQYFDSVIEMYQKSGLDVKVETLGIRPCSKGVEKEKLDDLTRRHKEIIKTFADYEAVVEAGSTDANTSLSHGIPSNVIGTVLGGGAHTRGEWIITDSLTTGQKIGLGSVLQYFTE